MGKLISESCLSLLKDLKCDEETVWNGIIYKFRCSDSRMQSIQNLFNRRLSWFACRHHVGEVILTHAVHSILRYPKALMFLCSKGLKINFNDKASKFFAIERRIQRACISAEDKKMSQKMKKNVTSWLAVGFVEIVVVGEGRRMRSGGQMLRSRRVGVSRRWMRG